MKFKGLFATVVLMALMLGLGTSASAITLQFVGAPYGQTGPYSMQLKDDLAVGGVPSLRALPDQTILMICSDVAGGVPGAGVTWEVQKHSLTAASLASGVGDGDPAATRAKFYGDHNIANFLEATEKDYRAGAWLADQLFKSAGNAALEDKWHRALWGLFNLTQFQGGQYALDRVAAYNAIDGIGQDPWDGWKSYAVYTRVPLTGPPGGTQEFYARVPEAAALASFGLYLGSLGLLGYAFRRRMK